MEKRNDNTAGYLADSHLHSHFSPDSAELLEEICESALKRGLSEITVTDHVDIRAGQIAPEWFAEAQTEAARLARLYEGRLAVRFGVELGQPQDDLAAARRVCQSGDFDFIIGSIHELANGSDPYECDFATVDREAYYASYLERLIDMARESDFDVAGHLTYPLRYMYLQLGCAVELDAFTDRFRVLFELLTARGRGIEVNTSGYRQPIGAPYPPAQVLRLYRECGGEIITIGSDAHRAQDVGTGVREATALLRELGFRYYMTFAKRKPDAHPL